MDAYPNNSANITALIGILALLIVTMGYWVIQMRVLPSIEPYWLAVMLLCIPGLLWFMRKHAPVLVAGLLFIGRFKDQPAEGISLTDPTFIFLALVAGSIFMDLLFTLSRTNKLTLFELFAGQKAAILSFIAFVFMVLASYSYAPDLGMARQKLVKFVLIDGMLFFTPLVLFKSDKEFRQFAVAILLWSVALAAYTVRGVLHPPEVGANVYLDLTRIFHGQMLGVTIFILYYYRFVRRFARAIIIFSLAVMFVGLMSTVARGPIVGTFLILGICSWLLEPRAGMLSRKAIRMSIVLVLVFAGVVLTALQQLPVIRGRAQAKEEQLVAMLEGSNDPGGSTTNRLQLYARALHAISLRPALGWGVAGWIVFQTDDNQGPYPHNLLLEVGVEEGLAGLTLLVIFLTMMIRTMRKNVQSGDRRYDFLIPVLGFIFLTAMVSGDLDNRIFWFWSGALFAASRIILLERKSDAAVVAQEPELAYA